ncbi:DUF4293 domain-containing protein [Adhaeribacter radiodurans]|uniref:DUF4293 domain-containing protein n=1 Tax=Adhaeribacter radiodurans TaxID=2745197 RepID=A0A7L7L3G9_9BACT|nr:DUF4293 domain-containing protein [Adhaeribacter radiodurans]QMU27358.1 DUF4293 domain-containing protein [Adhaeribacter radiodurans]
MIQRIQSVFLFLIAVALICLLFLPIWSKTDANGQEYVLNAFSLAASNTPSTGNTMATVSKSTIAIAILAILAALVALYEIFQYKNRLTQMKLGFLNTLLLAGLMGSCFYYVSYVGEEIVKTPGRGEYETGFYLPLLALALNALANRFIRRDEQLVRSVDRLR